LEEAEKEEDVTTRNTMKKQLFLDVVMLQELFSKIKAPPYSGKTKNKPPTEVLFIEFIDGLVKDKKLDGSVPIHLLPTRPRQSLVVCTPQGRGVITSYDGS
jgi:hypothetical protein